MTKLILEIYNFCKNPNTLIELNGRLGFKLFFSYLFISLIIGFILSMPATILFHLKLVPSITLNSEIIKNNFVIIILIAPIIEEAIFRLSLKFKPIYLALSLSLFFSFFFIDSLNNTTLLLLVCFVFSILLIIFQKRDLKIYLNNFWNRKFPVIFYSSAILFAIMHLTIFEFSSMWQIFVVPFLILANLSCGLIYGFIRIRFGILYTILLHITNNLILSLPFFFSLF